MPFKTIRIILASPADQIKPVSHITDHVIVGLASPHSPTSKKNRSRCTGALQEAQLDPAG